MSTDTLLGLLLSLPIGIVTALITPWFQRKLENIDKQRSMAAQIHNAKEEFENISFYKQHPDEFTQYLVHVAIQTTFTSAAIGIVSWFIFVAAQVIRTLLQSEDVTTLLYVL
jgi:hypothetical protein